MIFMPDYVRLYNAREFATALHINQVDKVGVKYYAHLHAVAEGCRTMDGKIVAWVHDAPEDTYITIRDLTIMGFLKKKHIKALELLTKPKDVIVDRETYIWRIGQNKIATEVKLSDLRHNMDLKRFHDANIPLTDKDWKRYGQYKKDYAYLLSLQNG